MNDTLLNMPNLPSFGNGLDRTVKFTDDGVTKNKLYEGTIESAHTTGAYKSKSPYQRWSNNQTTTGHIKTVEHDRENFKSFDSRTNFDLTGDHLPVKCSSELKKNMKTLVNYSSKFKNKKCNNYDNQIVNNQVGIYEKLNCKATEREYVKEDAELGKVRTLEDQLLNSTTSGTFKTPLRDTY